MDIVILTRRGIQYQQVRRGEQCVLYVPSPEAIKIYKDVTDTRNIAERYGASGQPPLWRQIEGQAVVYGALPESLSQRRQALKVWLAQDFAPVDCTAFYYVFGEKWVIHGRRETDDEGRRDWRVTLLKAEDGEASMVQLVTASISDQMLDDVESKTYVAVNENLALYEALQTALKPLNLQPIPFSTLKPSPKARPLYRQRDYSLLMMLSVLVALLIGAAVTAFWFVNWLQASKLEEQITGVRQQIRNVEINKSIGQVREPENVLKLMQKAFEQKPSAIMDAAARFGAEFGSLEQVTFATGDASSQRRTRKIHALEPGQHSVQIAVSKITNRLLVDQERLASVLLRDAPWLRLVENTPLGRGELTLDVVMQVEQPGGAK